MTKIVMLEFNELCPSLLDRWMAAGQLPNFKALHDASDVFVTESDEPAAPNLEPWIQWYSMHTGLPYQQHRVFHLTDGPGAGHPDIWSVLADSGRKVWNCSSMNARGFDRPGSAFLPDPWCVDQRPSPKELGVFHDFVARMVQEYTNESRRPGLGDVTRFLTFMAGHGLDAGTVVAILRQLLEDKRSGGKTTWKRATILDRLLFCVFRHYYGTLKPDFATFFCNSTAHLQHSYWRCMEPDAFSIKPSPVEIDRYGDAVLYGYQQMDRLVGQVSAMIEPGTVLTFSTALSQQPFTKYEEIGGQRFYRPRNVERFLADLAIAPASVNPVMTHQYQLRFASAEARDAAAATLARARVGDKPVFNLESTVDDNSIYFGCTIKTRQAADAMMTIGNAQTPFNDVFYLIDEIKSGRHHPDGCFWVRRGQHRKHQAKVSILDIMPTFLGMYGLPARAYAGRDLFAAATAARPVTATAA